MTTTVAEAGAAASEFQRWLSDGGADATAVRIHHVDDCSRFVTAQTPLADGQRLLVIPHPLFMTERAAKNTPWGQRFVVAGLTSSQHLLAAFLCEEKSAAASPWKPYIDYLPPNFTAMPLKNMTALTPALRGTRALRILQFDFAMAAHDFQTACTIVPEFSRHTFEAYLWARTAVYSRSWGATVQGELDTMLVPFMDLINHATVPSVQWTYDDTDNGFVLSMLRGAAVGDELSVSYGRYSNSVLFAKYGFAFADNPVKEGAIYLHPDTSAQNEPWLTYLGSHGPFVFPVQPDYQVAETAKLFSTLRVLHASREQLATLVTDQCAPDVVAPLSLDNERRVLAALREAAQIAMSPLQANFSVSKSAQSPLARLMADALLVRRDERDVLAEFIGLADALLPLLHAPRAALSAAIDSLAKDEGLLGSYVRGALRVLSDPA